ncbi:MAG: hypothetical protein GX968_06725 [Tissierellia bacterium]|nr:hypothetical protein [Tissierellia bacterium]
MSKGIRIFYMFSVLFIVMVAINLIIYERTGIMYMEEIKITFTWLGVNLILSIALINLWDYVSSAMEHSPSVLWKIFRGAVVGIAWFLAGLIAIFIILGILLDMGSHGFFDSSFMIIMLVVWGVISIVNAINSFKKGS